MHYGEIIVVFGSVSLFHAVVLTSVSEQKHWVFLLLNFTLDFQINYCFVLFRMIFVKQQPGMEPATQREAKIYL